MKNFRIMKTLVLLVARLAFISCEENGPIQQVVKTDTSTSITVTDLDGKSSYSITDTADISELVDGVDVFVAAEIESVGLKLENYSGGTIEGNITVKVGGITLFTSETVSLSSVESVVTVPAAARNILTLIQSSSASGQFGITLEGNTTNGPITDDNDSFTLVVTPTITGTVEL